jgi:hypothetical protein
VPVQPIKTDLSVTPNRFGTELIVSETWGTVGVATATANTVLMIEPHSLDELTAIPHALPSAESELEVNRVRLAADEQLAPIAVVGSTYCERIDFDP